MKNLRKILVALRDDVSGASFLEYTVLLGILLAGSIATIALVGTWTGTQWVNLNAALPVAPAP